MMVTLCVALLIYFADKNIIPTLVIRVVKWQIDSISLDYCLILKHGHTIWFYVYRLRCAQTLFDQAEFFYLKCMKNIKLQWPTCRQYLRYSRKNLYRYSCLVNRCYPGLLLWKNLLTPSAQIRLTDWINQWIYMVSDFESFVPTDK